MKKETIQHDELDLTIIIPAYNVSSLLRRCLNSILCQLAPLAFECIIVDDESTDDTFLIASSFKELWPNVHIISKVNGGVGAARNAAIPLAKGKYIWFVDSDDYVAENSLVEIKKIIDGNEPHDIFVFYYTHELYGRQQMLSFGDRVPAMKAIYDKSCEYKTFSMKDYSDLLKTQFYVWSKLYRTNFVRENGILFHDSRVIEDMLFCAMAYLRAEKIKTIPVVLYIYNIGRPEGQCSSMWDERRLSAIAVFDDLNALVSGLDLPLHVLKPLRQNQIEIVAWLLSKIRADLAPHFEELAARLYALLPVELLPHFMRTLPHNKFANLYKLIFREFYAEEHDKPLLSIIISLEKLHDAETDRLLYNMVNQSMLPQPFEVLLLCDQASGPDKIALKYAAEYGHCNIFPCVTQSRGEIMKKGLEEANGKYIHFIDHILPGSPEVMKQFVAEASKQNADIAFGNLQFISQRTGKLLKKESENSIWQRVSTASFSKDSADRRRLIFSAFAPYCGRILYRKSLLEKIKVLDETGEVFGNESLLHWASITLAENIRAFSNIKMVRLLSDDDDLKQMIVADSEREEAAMSMLDNELLFPGGSLRYQPVQTYHFLRWAEIACKWLPAEMGEVQRKLLKRCPHLKISDIKQYRRFFYGPQGLYECSSDFFASRYIVSLAKLSMHLGKKITQ